MDDFRRLVGFSYLKLQDGKSEEWVASELATRGISAELANAAISEARRNLKELAAYRNKKLLMQLGAAVALIVFGLWLSGHSGTAPGRFKGIWLQVVLLGGAVFAYGIWSRSLRN